MTTKHDDEETLGSRLIRENQHLKRGQVRWYGRVRQMEEAIRKHAEGRCDCPDTGVCLLTLYRLTPTKPRPTWRKLFRR